ncbi:MAG: regulatory protein RecX [Proteobacteria bacterium]|nr:regulatory protein RecX [Pseudomonadota bacterium]
MIELHKEISDLLSTAEEDRFSSAIEARKKAMVFLARREYGQTELVNKLVNKGYMRQVAEQAIVELTAAGLQSDQRFAANFVRSRISQGKGPVRMRSELGQRGIDSIGIKQAIEAAGADWDELACEVRLKKFGDARPVDFKAKARQMRFLQYRGFERDHIKAATGA